MAGKEFWQKLVEGQGDTPLIDTTPETPELSFEAPQGIDSIDPLDVGAFTYRLMQLNQGVKWSRSMLVGGGDTIVAVNVSPEQRLTMAASEADSYLSQLYGADVTPWLMASRITDPVQRDAMMTTLRSISQGDVSSVQTRQITVAAGGRGGAQTVTQYLDPTTGEWSNDPPDVASSMTGLQGAGVNELTQRSAAMMAFLATRVDTLQNEPTQRNDGTWVETGGGDIVSAYDYESVLTPNQIAQLDQAVGMGTTDRGLVGDIIADTSPIAGTAMKGSFVRVEQGSNTYEFNEDFMTAHPTKALAMIKYIEEKHPGAVVRVGGQGMLHPALDMLSRPLDIVSAPVTLAYKWAARGFGEVGEAAYVAGSGMSRDEFGQIADQLEGDIQKGIVPTEQIPEMLNDISRFRDYAIGGNIMNEGESIGDDIHDAFLPEQSGLALANMSADAIGLYPGDPGYDAWVAGVGLIHGFSAADPLGWVGAIRKGASLAKTTTVGNISGVARKGATVKGLSTFISNGGTATRYLSDSQWVRISAHTDDASDSVNEARLTNLLSRANNAAQAQGFEVVRVTNADGTADVMIMGMDAEQGLGLARGMGQDSFRTADGIIHTADRTITPVDWVKADDVTDIHAADTDILHAPDGAFAMRMDVPDPNVRLKPAPPKVSQNAMVQAAFERFAKTPDEMLYTEQATQTADRLHDEISAARRLGEAEYYAAHATDATVDGARRAAVDKALSVLASWSPSYDPGVLRALADARSGGQVHQVLSAAMLGGIKDPFHLDKLLTRQAEIATRLGALDNELSQYGRIQAQLADFAERIGVTDRLDQNLTRLRDFTNGGQGGQLRKLVSDYQAARAKLAQLDAERVDLIGERYSNQSMLDLDEITLPIRQLPDDKLLRVLTDTVKASERSPVEDLLVALSKESVMKSADKAGELMAELERTLAARGTNPRQIKRLLKQAEKAANGQSREAFRVWRNIQTKMTGGLSIYMPVPGHGVPEKQLSDYVMRTLTAVRDRGKLFGLQQADIEELITAYLRIDNREDWYRFVKKLYEDIANKSPYLDARSRGEMRQTHQDLLDERGGGYLVKIDGDGVSQREHTLQRVVTDPATGQLVHSGVPAFSGDWLDAMRLPSNEIDMQHLSTVRRWTERGVTKGGLVGASAQALMGARDVINASTYVWKSAVLMGRMPFALLSRIQGEQAWRMAALDYASAVNHPLDWFRSVMAKGEFSRFADSHAEFLGTLVDNYNEVHSFGKSVHVARRGRQALSPLDGERYWNALSGMFLRRFRSGEVAYYLDHNPQEILDWLRGPNSGPLGDGIIENIVGTRAADEVLDSDAFLLDRLGRMKGELDDLVGGSDRLKAALKRGSTEPVKAPIVLEEGEQLMSVTDLQARLQFGSGRAARTPEQISDLRVQLRGGYDPNKGIITVQYDPVTQRVLVPEGHHRIDILADNGVKKIKVRVENVDTATIEGRGSMLPPTNPAAPILKTVKPSVGVGDQEFATMLRELHKAGDYIPPQFVNSKASEYVMGNPRNLAARFRDWSFQKFYSQPDVYLSRGPMFRQSAAREYDRLRGLGWSEKRAEAAAVSWGAEQTAGWMYDLASRTSGQYFLRNIMPFFPAFQELGGVWLKRLPMQAGGGGTVGWAAGAGLYSARTDRLQRFFEDTGMIQKDAEGEWTFAIPGLDQIFRSLTGEEGAQLRFRADSIAGMLPFPRLNPEGGLDITSIVPGLGPWPSMLIGKMAEHSPVIDELSNLVLPYGDNVKIGPTSINNLFYATGHVPPWEYMTRDTQQLMIDFSVEDALRSVHSEMEPFNENWSKSRKEAWSEELVSRAEKRSSAHYLTRAAVSMLSPVSVNITSEYEQDMTAIWRFVENYREGTGESASSPLIEGFKAAYPGAVWYTNGRSITHGERTGDDFDAWIKDWQKGYIRTFSPQEQVQWNLGMTQYWNTVGRTSQTTKGMTASEILSTGFDRKSVTAEAWGQFDMYLTANPKFAEMFADWQSARDEQLGTVSQSAMQDRLVDIKRQLQAIDDVFTTNGIRDADYMKVVGKLTENIDYISEKSDDPVWNNVSWWYKNVGTPATEAMGALYDAAFALPKPEQGPIFEQIRLLKNSFDETQHNGETYPSPEAVWWANKSVEEQQLRKLEWASSPLEWLSGFEMQTAGYEGGPLWDEMAGLINTDKAQLQKIAADNYLSTSSSEYLDLQRAYLVKEATWASDNGMLDEFALTQAAPYQRVLATGAYAGNRTFEAIAGKVVEAGRIVEAEGYSVGGNTEIARRAQQYVFQQIDQARQSDPEFDSLMGQFEVAFADAGREKAVGYEMYFKLFFDYFGPTPYVQY